MHTNTNEFCLHHDCLIRDVIVKMDHNGLGIVLIVDAGGCLTGTVTDGDIRRAILAQVDLNLSIQVLLGRKKGTAYSKPLTAPAGGEYADYVRLLKQHQLFHLPLLDKNQRVVGLVTMDEFVDQPLHTMQAVVMAGGLGSRLYPLTQHVPKPMLPVGDKPLLEHTFGKLRDIGIRRINVTTHHKSDVITNHFGNGEDFGVEISYVSEERPLGTAGALGLVESPQETLLVINGDIWTEVDFKAMLRYHREHNADMTVGARQYDVQVPYGILECDGADVQNIQEKPCIRLFANAGIYLLEPSAHRYVKPGERCDMTDLIQLLVKEKKRVVGFPIRETWIDIGDHEEYRLAQEEIKKNQK